MAGRRTEDGKYAMPVLMMARTTETNVEYCKMDSLSHAMAVMDYEHSELHGGSAFTCHYSQEVSDTGDQTIVAFKTGSTDKQMHATFAASSSMGATATLIEAPTITDNTGASLTIYNRNRTSTKESEAIDTSANPDVENQAMYFTEATMGNVTSGTVLDTEPLQAGKGNKALGGVSRGEQEWILKKSTLYAFVVESTTDEDNTHRITVDWYEHTPR